MKICPDCHSSNSDASITCTMCRRYLSEEETKAATEAFDRELANDERLERKKRHRKIALVALAICVGVALNVFAVWAFVIGRMTVVALVAFIVMEFLGLLLLLLPQDNDLWSSIFWGEAGWALQNPENAQPNWDFFLRYKLVGVVLVIGCIAVLVSCAIR